MPLFARKIFDDSSWGRLALEHFEVYSYANVEYLSLSLVETFWLLYLGLWWD